MALTQFKPAPFEIAIQATLAAVLLDRPVIFSRQSNPRPSGAYTTIYVFDMTPNALIGENTVLPGPGPGGGDGAGKVIRHYQGEATIQVYRDGARTALEDALTLGESFSDPNVHASAAALGLYLAGSGAVTNLDIVVADTWEARYTFDMSFSWARTTEFDSYIIETTDITLNF